MMENYAKHIPNAWNQENARISKDFFFPHVNSFVFLLWARFFIPPAALLYSLPIGDAFIPQIFRKKKCEKKVPTFKSFVQEDFLCSRFQVPISVSVSNLIMRGENPHQIPNRQKWTRDKLTNNFKRNDNNVLIFSDETKVQQNVERVRGK